MHLMKRLIITNTDSAAGCLKASGIADMVLALGYDLVDGPAPLEAKPEQFFAVRAALAASTWEDWEIELNSEASDFWLELIKLGAQFDRVELWIDPDCNAQLQLVQFLDWVRSHPDTVDKLVLVHGSRQFGEQTPEEAAALKPLFERVTESHLRIATMAWNAYRQPTPEMWFSLLTKPLKAIPRLPNTILEMLNELPSASTALGDTQLRILRKVNEGAQSPLRVLGELICLGDKRPVFGYWTLGRMLHELAHGQSPALAGLEEGPFTLALHDEWSRLERYKRSVLALTQLGKALVTGRDDYARHNQIDRWWGGTRLTNSNLWRWDNKKSVLIPPP